MQQLGMPEMAVDIRHLLNGDLEAMAADTLGQLSTLVPRLNEAVARERCGRAGDGRIGINTHRGGK